MGVNSLFFSKIPVENSKFCTDHMQEETPCLSTVSKETKKVLDENRKKSRNSNFKQSDDFFVVKSVLEKKSSGSSDQFLIEWLGYDRKEATWEPSENIPGFIRDYYKDCKNLGKDLPQPIIKHRKALSTGNKIDGEPSGNTLILFYAFFINM